MASDRFPYDLPPFRAMVRLIQETYPAFKLTEENAKFSDVFFDPTPDIPGRTFVQVENTILNVKESYVYRRLDLGITFSLGLNIAVNGAITPRSIAEEINRSHGMALDKTDVSWSNIPLVPIGGSVVYRMRALPGSHVWYGETLVTVVPASIPVNARRFEDGQVRYTEDGTIRILETN